MTSIDEMENGKAMIDCDEHLTLIPSTSYPPPQGRRKNNYFCNINGKMENGRHCEESCLQDDAAIQKENNSQSSHVSRLTLNVSQRYNRNILVPQVGEEGQKKLSQAKILVCGAGGLGSTVLANLAGVGIGTIGVVDNDVLELSNLNRQYIHKFENIGAVKVESAKKWINEFNPETIVNTYPIRLDENNYAEIVKDYDFIMDCFDSFKSKFLLNKIAVQTGKTLIHGGVTEFFGQVTVIKPKKTACLNCILEEEGVNVAKGVLSPAVTTIASIEAMEVVKLILNTGESLENKLLNYNGLTMQFKTINLARNPNCISCS